MKARLLVIGGVLSVLAVLIFMAAGAINWAVNARLDFALGKGADARAEGEAAVLQAQAAAIEAETQRQNAEAVSRLEFQRQVSATLEEMYAGLAVAGKWTGAFGLIVILVAIPSFLAWRLWISNHRLRVAPVQTQRGPIVATRLDSGDVVITNTDNGFCFRVSPSGTVEVIGMSDKALATTALANAVRHALLSEGFARADANRVVNTLRTMLVSESNALVPTQN